MQQVLQGNLGSVQQVQRLLKKETHDPPTPLKGTKADCWETVTINEHK